MWVERSRYAESMSGGRERGRRGRPNGRPMTPLRAKYIRDLVIRGRSKHTQEAYIRYVYDLARYYRQVGVVSLPMHSMFQPRSGEHHNFFGLQQGWSHAGFFFSGVFLY